jgi:hypothetical protein
MGAPEQSQNHVDCPRYLGEAGSTGLWVWSQQPSLEGSTTVHQLPQAHHLPDKVQQKMFQIDWASLKFLKILLVTHVMLRFSDANGARGAYDLDDGRI